MNINRHNYEEFFLLYVDGELSAQEWRLVELFVQENADLANELKMFEQTKLQTEAVVFADKSSLYKTDNAIINTDNYEENFLLYIDDELSNTERNEIETFVLHHPKLQDEFILLQQTKLESETIIFPDKKALYKKAERRVIYFSWQRISVAAAFIGFAVLIWDVLPVTKVNNQNMVVSNNQSQKTSKNNLPATPVTNQVKENTTVVPPSNTAAANNRRNVHKKINTVFKERNDVADQFQKNAVTKIDAGQSVNETKKTDAIIAVNNNPKNSSNNDVINTSSTQPKNISTSNQTNTNPQSLVQNTVYKELDTDEDIKNNNLYIGSIGINKDKVRGLLKRASHLFDKTNDDDKNLTIANFAVNTKSLK